MSHDDRTAGEAPADPIPPEARAANLALWNHWTTVHEKSAFYDVEGFKAGATSLWPVEREELGPLVREGTSLLHLQCHFGLDTLSWARLGADVVGLDLSDEAIALARRLAAEVGLADRAEFVCADLYDADAHLGGRLFDIVFVSWGAIEWLPDLGRWADIVARHLKPGGTFYMAEIHPFAYALDEVPGQHDVQVKYRLLPAPEAPDVDPVEGSYADPAADTTGLTVVRVAAQPRGDHRGAGRRRPPSGTPPRVRHLPVAVLELDGPRRGPLVVASRRRRRAAQGPAPELLAARLQAGGRGGLTMLDDYLKANLASWDEAVGLHVGSELYDVAGFRAGRTALSAIELDELGPLVGPGTSLLHLQCHFGLDTLSWARRGAEVTGVDFSGRGHQHGARAGRRRRPHLARHLRPERRRRACRTSSPGSSTWSSPPGERSSGWPTSSAGPM